MFLSFFESKGHLRFPSHPIPVYGDPTLMFSVAGMAQFKPQFVGAPAKFPGVEGEHKRVTTAQKCIRLNDIENVGRTSRHCSLFEMMGNFSFDSYFKKEAIEWAWELLTSPDWLGFDGNRMYVTIYKDDDEAFEYWTKNVGLEASRIHRFDADENFWPQNAPSKGPNGPCGPCSEIYYDRGEVYGTGTWAEYAITRESARFLEVWNLVFPGYNRSDGADGKGELEELGRRNIDTGLGLVRVAMVSQGVEDFYLTDDFKPLIDAIVTMSGKPYEGMSSLSHRVIAEHIRMVSMTLADGVSFGTSEREYVVRKVMRRASRHAYLLGMKEPTLYKLVPIVAQTLGQAYPEMVAAEESVAKQIQQEEERFLRTLENGIERLEILLSADSKASSHESTNEERISIARDLLYQSASIVPDTYGRTAVRYEVRPWKTAKKILSDNPQFSELEWKVAREFANNTVGKSIAEIRVFQSGEDTFQVFLSGEDTFTLYDTFGFPLDLTREIVEEQGFSVDEEGFNLALKEAQALARAGSKYGKKDGVFGGGADALEGLEATEFVGYDSHLSNSSVVALVKDGARVEAVSKGESVEIVLDATPFYAEGGGQVGDTGRLEWNGGAAVVTGTQKNAQGVYVHSAKILRGTLQSNSSLEALVEIGVRAAVEKHHTATHLLQAALRATLGNHVQQKGSLVSADRLRFDFTHNQALTPLEIRQVEMLVNRWVQADYTVTAEIMPLEEARKTGAMALFGEKYGDTVRVVSIEGSVSSVGILERVQGGLMTGATEVSSMELCGGTHVPSTGSIGSFVITSEEGVAAGVRRLEALTGEAATAFVRDTLERSGAAARALGTTPELLTERLEKLQEEFKQKDKEIAALKTKLMQAQTGSGSSVENLELGGFKVARLSLTGVSGNELRGAADDLLERSKADIVVVASDGGLAVKVSKEAVARGAHAGQLISKLAAAGGGKGGGRPDMAQAGVKDTDAALAALEGAFG